MVMPEGGAMSTVKQEGEAKGIVGWGFKSMEKLEEGVMSCMKPEGMQCSA